MAALVMTSTCAPVMGIGMGMGMGMDRRPLSRGSSSGSTSVYVSRTPSAASTPSAARTAAAIAAAAAAKVSESGQGTQVTSKAQHDVSQFYDDMAGEPLEADTGHHHDDEEHYRSADRHARAKAAARALLAQFMQEDSDPTSAHMTPTLHYHTRLGLAPITLLLNPETPCPTKIIPLAPPTDDEDMSSISTNGSSYASSTASDEAEVQKDRTAPPTHGFIRLL